ncbi:hypothetical protein M011DRAFT_140696 [Sporormia fimetaria CBS 119925]|uniref:Uncharacterized protein n=1 Tax=Sporormia fimetaria CBS 119925 TaxID=1340428 RepID=A0A6A6V6V6_9PLEO|nr:hypothetical protein M011DRAFT_140696 [Sporormia fimetaria CBS 119925]
MMPEATSKALQATTMLQSRTGLQGRTQWRPQVLASCPHGTHNGMMLEATNKGIQGNTLNQNTTMPRSHLSAEVPLLLQSRTRLRGRHWRPRLPANWPSETMNRPNKTMNRPGRLPAFVWRSRVSKQISGDDPARSPGARGIRETNRFKPILSRCRTAPSPVRTRGLRARMKPWRRRKRGNWRMRKQ